MKQGAYLCQGTRGALHHWEEGNGMRRNIELSVELGGGGRGIRIELSAHMSPSMASGGD